MLSRIIYGARVSLSIGLMLNLRVMEVDFLVGSQSDDFVKSFAGAGLGSYNFV